MVRLAPLTRVDEKKKKGKKKTLILKSRNPDPRGDPQQILQLLKSIHHYLHAVVHPRVLDRRLCLEPSDALAALPPRLQGWDLRGQLFE